MTILYNVLLVLHLLGWAIVFGGALAGMKKPALPAGALHGILTALVTGILMVGLAESGVAGPEHINNMKVGIKLLIAAVATGVVVYGVKKPAKVTRGFLGGVAGLVVLNVAIAVLWR
ncbi:hypothetical protein QUV83_12675 [Cellulomonas cellasea]|uniref:hypothetical protein n=1 Tax=Cellulomonas cellasea TaxID=43670 RepID=UPI0025A3E4C0|nr:hypothetical protein [Cellulomonas cellasea]MDM8085622.1 hypothetical protein [Cellulomonas cellasea]